MAVRVLTTDRGDAGRRLDLVLRRHLIGVPAATRTRVQAWIEGGQVSVNGTLVRRVAARTTSGDQISVVLPDDAARVAVVAQDYPLDLLFEDEHLLIVNKPAGMVVHPTYRNRNATLINALLWRAQSWPECQRPSLVGRLDKLTSGIVLIAKSRRMHAALQRTMASRQSEKAYLAIVYGRVRSASGMIQLGLARDRNDRRRVIATAGAGSPAETKFERLSHSVVAGVAVSALKCRLLTGRMHQIRVHLSARGWPIVGDPVYGEPRWTDALDPAIAAALEYFPRQALHAWQLAFDHPATRTRIVVAAPVPDDMRRLMVLTELTAATQ